MRTVYLPPGAPSSPMLMEPAVHSIILHKVYGPGGREKPPLPHTTIDALFQSIGSKLLRH